MIGALVAGITGSGGASLSSYESIASATGTGTSSANIVFSSIPATYTHLQIRAINRDTLGGTGTSLFYVRFNGDTGSNYVRHRLWGNGTSASSSGAVSQSFIEIFGSSFYSGSTNVGASIIDVLDYASTTKNKTTRNFSGNDNNGSGFVNISSGLWLNTAAITSITLVPEQGFGTATQFALYGIKAAA